LERNAEPQNLTILEKLRYCKHEGHLRNAWKQENEVIESQAKAQNMKESTKMR
jgi:hypothetical protein